MPIITKKKPAWLRIQMPGGERYKKVKNAVKSGGLHTVCQEAKCPNIGECWDSGTATFMILGDICTRGCQFCAVKRGDPNGNVDIDEPHKIAAAVKQMKLDYVVVTSVTRDDLKDGGAQIFANTVNAIKVLPQSPLVELLTPDYLDDDLKTVLNSNPAVFAHNVEVVERLSKNMRHLRFNYKKSLKCLEQASKYNAQSIIKSSIMLGVGETDKEIEATMKHLITVGTKILVVGQYLQPTKKHARVERYVTPEKFEEWKIFGEKLGFSYVAAGPLVRTSYKAAEAFVKNNSSI